MHSEDSIIITICNSSLRKNPYFSIKLSSLSSFIIFFFCVYGQYHIITKFNSSKHFLLRQLSMSSLSSDNVQLPDVIEALSETSYKGEWTSNSTFIGELSNGTFFMSIVPYFNSKLDSVTLISKAIEGNYVDNWNLIYSVSNVSDIAIINEKSNEDDYIRQFTLKGNFTSNANIGKVFDKMDKIRKCETKIEVNITHNILSNDNYINGIFNSSICNITFEFRVSTINEYAEYKIVNVYTIILTSFCLGSFLSSLWLTFLIKKDKKYSGSISIITVSQNGIWSIFCSITHLSIMMSYSQYFLQFGIIFFAYIINFICVDIRLFYYLWKMKYENEQPHRGKLFQIYGLIYFFFFFSLFCINKIYFDSKYIIFTIIITWLPQIIYNALYQINTSLPPFYIIFISAYRLFIPVYFKGYEYNFYLISPNHNIVVLSLSLMTFNVIILLSQRLFGSRWFIPSKCKDSSGFKYIDEKELKVRFGKKDLGDCVICLKKIVTDNIEEKVEIANGVTTKDDFGTFWNMFYFKERKNNINSRPFMITPCKHIFHSVCIDSWLEYKKECPYCRKELK